MKNGASDGLHKNLHDLKAVFSHRKPDAPSQEALSLDLLRQVIREEICAALQQQGKLSDAFKGIPEAIAHEIAQQLGDNPDPEMLQKHLAGYINIASPWTLNGDDPKIVAFVGPHGVGKTTTLMKIAAHYSENEKKRVALISFDIMKAGAIEQIKGLAALQDFPLFFASDSEQLHQCIKGCRHHDLIMIDTTGRSPYDSEHIEALTTLLATIPEVHVVLTLSALTRENELFAAIERFGRISLDSLVLTKLDETSSYEILLQLSLPLRYLSSSAHSQEGLIPADALEIARWIVK